MTSVFVPSRPPRRTEEGFTLIEVMVTAAAMVVVAMGVASLGRIMNKVQGQSTLTASASQIKNNLVTLINNADAWHNTINDPTNSASLGCVASTTAPLPSPAPSPQPCQMGTGSLTNPAYQISAVRDSSGVALGNIFYQYTGQTSGYTEAGTPCNSFSATPGSGNDACPLQYIVKWQPVCGSGSACLNPQVYVQITAHYNPSRSNKVAFNPQNYSVSFYQGITNGIGCWVWDQSNQLMYETCAKDVGIGTNSPISPVHAYSELDGTSNQDGFTIQNYMSPAAPTSSMMSTLDIETTYDSSQSDTTNLWGMVSQFAIEGSPTISGAVYGSESDVFNNSNGHLNDAIGSTVSVYNQSSGQINTSWALAAETMNNSTGTIGDALGVTAGVANTAAGHVNTGIGSWSSVTNGALQYLPGPMPSGTGATMNSAIGSISAVTNEYNNSISGQTWGQSVNLNNAGAMANAIGLAVYSWDDTAPSATVSGSGRLGGYTELLLVTTNPPGEFTNPIPGEPAGSYWGIRQTNSSAINLLNGRLGIGITPGFPIDAFGDVNSSTGYRVAGTLVCNSGGCPPSSDARLKKDVEPLKDSFSKILSLQGVSYFWKDAKKFSPAPQIGFIAQEVEKIFPQAVVTDPKTGMKSLFYDHLVAPLVEAFKTLEARFEADSAVKEKEIAELKAENAAMKARLDRLEKAVK